jgi:hypothetical protein
MPYGVDKSIGGDNESNDKWMESCVSKLEGKYGKSSAVAICKSQLKKKHESKSSFENTDVDLDVLGTFLAKQSQYVSKAMQTGRTHMQALADFESYLAKLDYNL